VSGTSTDASSGRPRDPARGLRAIGSALLVVSGLVVALSIPVVVSGGESGFAVGWLAAIAGLDVVTAAMLGRAERPALVAGTVLAVATIASGMLSGFLFFLGVLFGGLWVGWLAMRRSYARALASARPAPGDSDEAAAR
jgi:hypothetical protein